MACLAVMDYDAILGDDSIDGVLIATPPSAHLGTR